MAIPHRHKEPRPPLHDLLRDAADRTRHDRCTTGQSLENGGREGVGSRGVKVEVGGLVVAGDLLRVFQVRDKSDLDVAGPFRRGCFAEGDAEHFCINFRDLGKGGLQSPIVLPDVFPDTICCKEEDLRIGWQSEFSACLIPVCGMEDFQVHAVRDNLRCHNSWLQHRLINFIHQPSAGGDDIQPALPVDLRFAVPVVGRRIPPDSRVYREVRTVAAPGLPALTVEGVGAVTAEEPGVVEGEHGRNLVAEGGEGTEIEVATMEVVAVEDVGMFRCRVQEAPGSRVIEVLMAS